MDKITRINLNWKILLPLLVLLAAGLWAAPAVFSKVKLYRPPAGRDLSGWGSIDQAAAKRLQSALDSDVNRLKLPGLQVSIQTGEGQTWSGASGTIDPGRHTPLSREHIIRIGSVTKTFTAVIILLLAEQGELSLDDRLSRWFPDFPNANAITMREMLSHRSGIYDILRNPAVLGSLLIPRKAWQPNELVEMAAQQKPGAQGEYSYSNTNYILLGLIAEQLTGQDMASLYRQRIFEPLNLVDTYFVPYEAAPQILISGYDRDMLPWPGLYELKPNSLSAATAAYASGAMISKAEDLRIFYDGLFSGKLISPKIVNEMTTFFPATDPGTPQLTGYGLGLFRLDIKGQETWTSLGEFIGSMTMVTYTPGEGAIVAIIGNLSLFEPVSVWENLKNIYSTGIE